VRQLLVLAAAAMLAACGGDGPSSVGPAASIEIVTADTVLLVGAAGHAVAVVRDAAGGEIGSVTPTWHSSDSGSVLVGAGLMGAVELGTAWIIARHGALADSVQVRATVASIPLGEMEVRIRSGDELRTRWPAFGRFIDVLATDSGESSVLAAQLLPAGGGDSAITLMMPGRLQPGRYVLGKHVFAGPGTGLPTAFVRLDGPGTGDVILLGSIGGTLDVSAAAYPPKAGLEPGTVRGVLTLRAVRYIQGAGGLPVEVPETVLVNAEYHARFSHLLRPLVRLDLAGGPVAGASKSSTAQVSEDGHGGILVSWDSDFDLLPQGFRYETSQELRLAAPAVGTFPLGVLAPPAYADPAQWPAAFTALYYRDDPRIGLPTGGSVTITKYVAPTLEYYGEIHGTLTAPLALWSDDTTVSGSATATASFAVQLWPLGGIPVAPPIRHP
jgi:hypothetical protein